jgi:hypothetical protein
MDSRLSAFRGISDARYCATKFRGNIFLADLTGGGEDDDPKAEAAFSDEWEAEARG